MEVVTLDLVYKEMKKLREEIKELKSNKEEDLTNFVKFLEIQNQLGTEEDLRKNGIEI
jgi:hypothetical protein